MAGMPDEAASRSGVDAAPGTETAAAGMTLALSLWQPWATLVVLGAKRIETRSRATHHRGKLGIHATRSSPSWAREFALTPALQEAVRAACPELEAEWGDLFPTGVLLGSVRVVDCVSTNQIQDLGPYGRLPPFAGTFEDRVGDFSRDRFMWLLEHPERLATPIPARGGQFLWHTRERI